MTHDETGMMHAQLKTSYHKAQSVLPYRLLRLADNLPQGFKAYLFGITIPAHALPSCAASYPGNPQGIALPRLLPLLPCQHLLMLSSDNRIRVVSWHMHRFLMGPLAIHGNSGFPTIRIT